MDNNSKGQQYLKAINGSVQSRTYTFVVFTIIVVSILIGGAIRPTVSKITQINEEIKIKKVMNTQLAAKLDAIAALTNQSVNENIKLDNLPLIYPSTGNFSLLMSNIDEISKANGYSLQSITFGSSEKIDLSTAVLKPWTARIGVSGTRANFVKYLSQLEQMPMYPRITKVSYSNSANQQGQTSFSIELLIFKIDNSTFYK